MSGLIVLFWFVAGGVALRFLVLFIGVMSCMYVVWDVIGQCESALYPFKKKLSREGNRRYSGKTSDASEFARICGCCPSRGLAFEFLLMVVI